MEQKNYKNEKFELSKEFNKMSVAHESSKTALTYSHYAFDEKMFNLTIELPKLKVFKSNKLAEEKIIQKAAKKSRQKQHWHQSLQHQKFPTPFSSQKYGTPSQNASPSNQPFKKHKPQHVEFL